MTRSTCGNTRIVVVVVVVATLVASSGCVTTPGRYPARDDSWLTRSIPTAHSIAPRFPSDKEQAAIPAPRLASGHAFNAESVTIEEPSYDEPHSLAWTRDVQRYTADVLNNVAGDVAGPLATTARFTVIDDRRDFHALSSMHITLETRLPDGSTVRSDDVVGVYYGNGATTLETVVGVTALEGLIAAGVTDTVALSTNVAGGVNNPWFIASIAIGGASLALGASIFGIEAIDALGMQERWSDLYLRALRAHAADVRRDLVTTTSTSINAPSAPRETTPAVAPEPSDATPPTPPQSR